MDKKSGQGRSPFLSHLSGAIALKNIAFAIVISKKGKVNSFKFIKININFNRDNGISDRCPKF